MKHPRGHGAVRYRGGRWCARVLIVGEPERLIPMDQFRSKSQREEAKVEAAILAALEVKAWEARGEARRETVEDWADRWIQAKQQRGQTSWKAVRSHLDAHVLVVLKGKTMREVTSLDCERIVKRLDGLVDDGSLKWKSAVNIWGTVTKMFDDASRGKVLALRARDRGDNPTRDVRGPERGQRTQKVHLYPSEFLALVSCEKVPLRRRRAYAVGVYCYMRPGELEALAAGDIDLERGVITISRAMDRDAGGDATKAPKAGIGRLPFELELPIVPVLRAMVDDMLSDGRLVGRLGDPHALAEIIRADLLLAGQTRAELHTMTDTREWMTMHDLRTTGITWMAVRGDAPLMMMARAGHHDVKQTTQYVDSAMLVRRVYEATFPELPEALTRSPLSTEAMDNAMDTYSQVPEMAGDSGGSAWESNQASWCDRVTSREDTESQRTESLHSAPCDSGELQECPAARRLATIRESSLGRAADDVRLAALTGDQDATEAALEHLAELHAAETLGRGDA